MTRLNALCLLLAALAVVLIAQQAMPLGELLADNQWAVRP